MGIKTGYGLSASERDFGSMNSANEIGITKHEYLLVVLGSNTWLTALNFGSPLP